MRCLFAYSCINFVVWPSGTFSAAAYHLRSWLGQKHGCVKTSGKQSTCTPLAAAFSMNGTCASRMRSRICSGRIETSPLSPIWIKPHLSLCILAPQNADVVGEFFPGALLMRREYVLGAG